MHIDRRQFLLSVPALAVVPRVFAQPAAPQIRVRGINHVRLTVSDVKRSVDFYQGLFGMPLRPVSAANAQLVIGPGPLELTLSSDEGVIGQIDHFCLGVDGFEPDRVLNVLAANGVSKAADPGPMKVQVTTDRGATVIYFGDPDGIRVQLQDAAYCGGSGRLGTTCAPAQPSAKKGLIALKGYSHLTVFSTDAARSNAFYRQLFGMTIRSFQGPTAPTLAVGPGVEFLMFTGGGGGRGGAATAPPRPASINHFCMSVDAFDPDRILKTLEGVGIKPRESQTGPVGPLRHYVSMRMENRGGAKEGTAELYFTDPDGILVQLQDVRYCGGAGVLGELCPAI